MEVGAGRQATLARRVPEAIPGLHCGPGGNSILLSDMVEEQHPAGARVAVTIEVHLDHRLFAAGDDTGRRGGHPLA